MFHPILLQKEEYPRRQFSGLLRLILFIDELQSSLCDWVSGSSTSNVHHLKRELLVNGGTLQMYTSFLFLLYYVKRPL